MIKLLAIVIQKKSVRHLLRVQFSYRLKKTTTSLEKNKIIWKPSISSLKASKSRNSKQKDQFLKVKEKSEELMYLQNKKQQTPLKNSNSNLIGNQHPTNLFI